jgi:hypothetical protein
MLLTYGLRWHTSDFNICNKEFPSCGSVSAVHLLSNALLRFYLWWIVLYYIWIFVFLGKYIESRSFKTLYDRVAGEQLPHPPTLTALCRKPNEVPARGRVSLWLQPPPPEEGGLHGLPCALRLLYHGCGLSVVAVLVGTPELHCDDLHLLLLQRLSPLRRPVPQ